MNFSHWLVAVVAATGLMTQPPSYLYNFSWHTRGPAIVAEQARGSWTIETQVNAAAPQKIANDSLGVDLTAKSAVVVDRRSGAVLWEKNKDEVRPVGSITKLMTALVFLRNDPDLERTAAIGQADRASGGIEHLLPGDPIKIGDLLAVSLIASDNSATNALASASGLSRAAFVQAMNDEAARLGLLKTKFAEPTGLSDDNVSTASEIITLAQTAFDHELIRSLTRQDSYSFTSAGGRSYQIESTNKLLKSFIVIDAAKTGFINAAGHCIVAEVSLNGHEILAAVLGSASDSDRFQDLKMLSYWVEQNFIWPK